MNLNDDTGADAVMEQCKANIIKPRTKDGGKIWQSTGTTGGATERLKTCSLNSS